MNVRKKFREIMAGKRLVLMPGAYDALSARIIEAEGFQALVAGGYAGGGSMLAQADMGQALQQRHPALLRVVLLAFAPRLANFVLRGHRQLFEFRHSWRAIRRAFGRLRDEGLGCRGLLDLDTRGLLVREQ